MKRKISYLLGFALIAGVLVYLLLTTFNSSLQYYVTVSELMGGKTVYAGKTMKVAGRGSGIQKEEGASVYHFTLSEGGASLQVVYRGFVPDTFKEGSDVVATGLWNEEGTFIATEILAKCASKYEAKLKN